MEAIEAIERRVARAREIVGARPLHEDLLGAFLHGSSVRPYGDDESDLDIGMVVEDEAAKRRQRSSSGGGFVLDPLVAGPDGRVERSPFGVGLWEGSRKLADVTFFTLSEVAGPVTDVEHYRARHSRLLGDRDGRIERAIAEGAAPPPAALDRARIHYVEVTFLLTKLQSAHKRRKDAALQLLKSQLVQVAGRLLFSVRGSWPAPPSWLFEELELLGVPADVTAAMRGVLDAPELRALRMFRGKLDGYLVACGSDFPKDPLAVWAWMTQTPEGRRAWERWAWAIQSG